jgi:hypothetical protein
MTMYSLPSQPFNERTEREHTNHEDDDRADFE